MANTILRVLFWAGNLIFGFGLFIQSTLGPAAGSGYTVFGLVIIVIAVGFAVAPDILRKDQVVDVWSVLIEKANGKAGEVLNDTVAFLEGSKAPSLNLEKRKIATGFVGGVLGNERVFLVLTDRQRMSLRPYQIFINARDYGENLDVSWYLTCRPTIGQALASLVAKSFSAEKEITDLNVFDQQDVRAYVTNAHKCMQKAITKVLTGAGQDPSKVDWKSKGFLGIS